ncbi:PLP-dependent transferase [Byssothecium circinans]|uniref:PLP-dependent transferase n=1 Tax=Byssothecium circinans TaxID=147558 RepID=A0A6A5UD64_9PLEO|nr:PLP-dependent transferase [Byssothecium circinans]
MRNQEYPMLKGITYIDHAGTALPSKTLIETFSRELQTHLIANPHSASPSTPSPSQIIVESTRKRILHLFNASPARFAVIFVANATAGIKLVAEAFSCHEQGFEYNYHRDAHTSLVGVRELARNSHCLGSDAETEAWLNKGHTGWDDNTVRRPILFAYPAQSNMNGRRLPLKWASQLRNSRAHENVHTLLDIAALASTTPINLSDHTSAPDFLVMSFYKTYGFPDLGALIVRKDAAHIFDKKQYFGGGTTDMITCGEGKLSWVAKKQSLSARLEDGTLPMHSILALKCAIDVHEEMYGGLGPVSTHTLWLAKHMYDSLSTLRHANGLPVCHIYKDASSSYNNPTTQGAIVAFNIKDIHGRWVGSSAVGEKAMENKIHVRSGGLCNPAGMAHELGLTASDLQKAYTSGYRCGQDTGLVDGPSGMVRISLGACSTLEDVKVFVQFIENEFVVQSTWWV